MTTIENKGQDSNSKYSYLNDNNNWTGGSDNPKLKHFYNYQSLRISPNNSIHLNHDYPNNIQKQHKNQKSNIKEQLFDSRLSFQRYSPNYNRNIVQQGSYIDKNKQQKKVGYHYNVEFSPFQDNQVIEKLFVQELQTQYYFVKNQLKEYEYQNSLLKEKVKNLQSANQLQSKNIQIKNQQIIQIRNQQLIQIQKYQSMIQQLRTQIQILRTKNIGLFQQVQRYQIQIQHLTNQLIYKDLTSASIQMERCHLKQTKQKRQPGVLYLRRQQNQFFKRKKSMPGKLLNKTYAIDGLVKNQQWIQRQTGQLSQIKCQNQKIFLKYEHLIESMKNMYRKIQKQSQLCEQKIENGEIDLKILWKWIKKLGHFYSKSHLQNKRKNIV